MLMPLPKLSSEMSARQYTRLFLESISPYARLLDALPPTNSGALSVPPSAAVRAQSTAQYDPRA